MMRIGEAAKKLNVSTWRVRDYCNNGELKYHLTPKGQRVFEQKDIDEFLGRTPDTTEGITAFYLRASDGDKNALNKQLQQLTEQYGVPDRIYKDGLSGLNEHRTGLQRLIRDAEKGKIQHVRATYPDRISMFGGSYIEHILELAGVDVEYLFEKNQTPHEELIDDMMKLIASFSGRCYKVRSVENQKKLLKEAENILEQHQSEIEDGQKSQE